VKRYTEFGPAGETTNMLPTTDGDWCKWSDVEALVDERDRYKAIADAADRALVEQTGPGGIRMLAFSDDGLAALRLVLRKT
jgi:hypothetical protein